jgi:hypothetical protein
VISSLSHLPSVAGAEDFLAAALSAADADFGFGSWDASALAVKKPMTAPMVFETSSG